MFPYTLPLKDKELGPRPRRQPRTRGAAWTRPYKKPPRKRDKRRKTTETDTKKKKHKPKGKRSSPKRPLLKPKAKASAEHRTKLKLRESVAVSSSDSADDCKRDDSDLKRGVERTLQTLDLKLKRQLWRQIANLLCDSVVTRKTPTFGCCFVDSAYRLKELTDWVSQYMEAHMKRRGESLFALLREGNEQRLRAQALALAKEGVHSLGTGKTKRGALATFGVDTSLLCKDAQRALAVLCHYHVTRVPNWAIAEACDIVKSAVFGIDIQPPLVRVIEHCALNGANDATKRWMRFTMRLIECGMDFFRCLRCGFHILPWKLTDKCSHSKEGCLHNSGAIVLLSKLSIISTAKAVRKPLIELLKTIHAREKSGTPIVHYKEDGSQKQDVRRPPRPWRFTNLMKEVPSPECLQALFEAGCVAFSFESRERDVTNEPRKIPLVVSECDIFAIHSLLAAYQRFEEERHERLRHWFGVEFMHSPAIAKRSIERLVLEMGNWRTHPRIVAEWMHFYLSSDRPWFFNRNTVNFLSQVRVSVKQRPAVLERLHKFVCGAVATMSAAFKFSELFKRDTIDGIIRKVLRRGIPNAECWRLLVLCETGPSRAVPLLHVVNECALAALKLNLSGHFQVSESLAALLKGVDRFRFDQVPLECLHELIEEICRVQYCAKARDSKSSIECLVVRVLRQLGRLKSGERRGMDNWLIFAKRLARISVKWTTCCCCGKRLDAYTFNHRCPKRPGFVRKDCAAVETTQPLHFCPLKLALRFAVTEVTPKSRDACCALLRILTKETGGEIALMKLIKSTTTQSHGRFETRSELVWKLKCTASKDFGPKTLRDLFAAGCVPLTFIRKCNTGSYVRVPHAAARGCSHFLGLFKTHFSVHSLVATYALYRLGIIAKVVEVFLPPDIAAEVVDFLEDCTYHDALGEEYLDHATIARSALQYLLEWNSSEFRMAPWKLEQWLRFYQSPRRRWNRGGSQVDVRTDASGKTVVYLRKKRCI